MTLQANSFLDLFKATSGGATTSAPAAPVKTRARSASFSAFFVAKRAEGIRTASTHDSSDSGDHATQQLKEQRRRLMEQERQTARVVAQAAALDVDAFDLPVVGPPPAVDRTAEAQMRAEAREAARRAIDAEQAMFTAAIREPRSTTYDPSADAAAAAAGASVHSSAPPAAASDAAAIIQSLHTLEHTREEELLSPDSAVEAQEMTMDDIQQIVRGSGSFGTDSQVPDGIPSVSTTAGSATVSRRASAEDGTDTGSTVATVASVEAPAAPRQDDTPEPEPESPQAGDTVAVNEFVQLRQTKVIHGVQRMRAAAAGRTRSAAHVAVLTRRGLSTDPLPTGGLHIQPDQLPTAEAAARQEAHTVLAEQRSRCGADHGGPVHSPEPILISF